MSNNENFSEILQSIQSRIGDVARWLIVTALKGSITTDRKNDIRRAAEDIIKLVDRL